MALVECTGLLLDGDDLVAEGAHGRHLGVQVIGRRRLRRQVVRLDGSSVSIALCTEARVLQVRGDGPFFESAPAEVSDVPKVLLYPL